MTSEEYFKIGGVLGFIVGLITFIGSWWYCAANYGFLLGFGLGWLPAGIAAIIAGGLTMLMWGLVVGLIVLLVIWGLYEHKQDQDRASIRKEDRVEVRGPCVEQKRPDGSVESIRCAPVIVPGPPNPN